MPPRLAPTVFATSAEEALVAVDTYTVNTANAVKNALPDINTLLNLASFAGLRGGNLSANLSYFSGAGKGLQVSADSLLKGIIGSNPTLNSAVASLTGGTRASILGNSGYSSITATLGGITSQITNADLSSLTSVGSLIGGLSASPFPISFTDVRGLTNLTTNIISQASDMGIPGSFTSIATGIGQSNAGIMSAVTRTLSGTIVNRSSVDLLSSVASTGFKSQLTAARPSFVQDFVKNYALSSTLPASSYRSTALTVSSSFSSISSGWTKSSGLGGVAAKTLNLSRGFEVSDDFDKLLRANANYASVAIPTTNYANMDTSCKAVANVSNLPYDMDLAQISALKDALPDEVVSMLSNPVNSLQDAFPLLALA